MSEGFESDFERILSFRPLVGTDAAATVAGRGPGLFRGQINPIQSINAVQAAAESSNLSFEEMAAALPIAAQGSALNKGEAVETIATLSVLAKQFESAKPAATSLSTFASKAALTEETKGLGIIEALRVIQQMPESDRKQFLGESKELNTAYTLLSQNLQDIESTMIKVGDVVNRAGTDESFMMQGVRAALEGSPETAGLIEADKARIRKEIAQELVLARSGFGIESKRDEIRAKQFAEGVNAYDRYLNDRAGDIVEMSGNEEATNLAQEFGSLIGGFGAFGPQAARLFNLTSGQEENEQLTEINNELKRMNRPPTQSTPDADR